MDIPEWYNTDSLRAIYLYTEGVKVASQTEARTSALPYFKKVLEIDSLHAPSHYQIGDILAGWHPQMALRNSEIAYRGDSTNVDYLGLYGYALSHSDEEAKALRVYEKLIKLEPKNTYNYMMLASLYASNEMPYMALSVLDSAEYKLGRQKEFLGQKIKLLTSLNLHSRAIEEALAEIEANPRETDNYAILGMLYSDTRQDPLAEQSFQKALSLNPEHLESLLGLATHYKRCGQEEKMLDILKRVVVSDELNQYEAMSIFHSDVCPNDEFFLRHYFAINTIANALYLKYIDKGDVAHFYAEHLIRSGELEMALSVCKRGFWRSDGFPDSLFEMIVDIENYLGRPDSAYHYIRTSIQNHPDYSQHYTKLGYLQLSTGGSDSVKLAKKSFRKALKNAPNTEKESELYCVLADLESNPNRRCSLYEKSIEKNSENATALNNWAYSLIDTPKKYAFALEMSNKACELEPTNPTFLDTKAWLLFLSGEVAEAKRIMRQAISLDSDGDSTLLLHYGDILAAEGEAFMAEIYYKRALKAGEEQELIESRIAALKE